MNTIEWNSIVSHICRGTYITCVHKFHTTCSAMVDIVFTQPGYVKKCYSTLSCPVNNICTNIAEPIIQFSSVLECITDHMLGRNYIPNFNLFFC